MLLLAATTAASSAAQSTNVTLFQDMAVACLGELPPEIDRFLVDAPTEMPYLRSALVASWQADGREIFLAGEADGEARVSYTIEEADVAYARDDGRIARTVRLALRYTLTDAEGRVLADDRCARVRSDTIARTQVAAVQTDAYPETSADLPQGGWVRRVLEPAVLTAATAVALYLFYTLRTGNGEDS